MQPHLLSGKRVLIAEDEPVIAMDHAALLTEAGAEVIATAASRAQTEAHPIRGGQCLPASPGADGTGSGDPPEAGQRRSAVRPPQGCLQACGLSRLVGSRCEEPNSCSNVDELTRGSSRGLHGPNSHAAGHSDGQGFFLSAHYQAEA
jgi:hypothetical protein